MTDDSLKVTADRAHVEALVEAAFRAMRDTHEDMTDGPAETVVIEALSAAMTIALQSIRAAMSFDPSLAEVARQAVRVLYLECAAGKH